MNNVKSESVFFNRLIGVQAKNKNGRVCGKVVDIAVILDKKEPRLIALCLKKDDIIQYIDWKSVEFIKQDNCVNVWIKNIYNVVDFKNRKDVIFIKKDIINRQILDLKGKKIETVNDVRLATISDSVKIIAVDVGIRGRLRRRKLERFISKIAKFLGISFRNRLVVWEDLHPIFSESGKFELTTAYDKLKTLHAADLADIIEELDIKERSEFLKSLDIEKAADVFEEIKTEVQMSILKSLPDEYASDILETMPTDEAADILEELDETSAEKLLSQMDIENSGEIRQLMSYGDKSVGSIMSKEFVTLLPDFTIEQAMNQLKSIMPDDEEIPYLYIVNSKHFLLGVLSLIQIIKADKQEKIYDIMQSQIISVKDEENLQSVNDIFSKYPFMAVPVVNKAGELVGIVNLRDMYLELNE